MWAALLVLRLHRSNWHRNEIDKINSRQLRYWKGGSEMAFGLFSLGKEKIGDTGDVCSHKGDCGKWPVYCLSTDLHWLPADQAQRANAVAAAWNGTVTGLCSNTTRIIV
ncbi:unnamed protein product [Durusdinium trenchii]|uniref:Uncharacterized protein n=1 Tax=Durusdinium trenchii TaxID=1381693 RepID=A0ABP0RLN7_9DINO